MTSLTCNFQLNFFINFVLFQSHMSFDLELLSQSLFYSLLKPCMKPDHKMMRRRIKRLQSISTKLIYSYVSVNSCINYSAIFSLVNNNVLGEGLHIKIAQYNASMNMKNPKEDGKINIGK